MNSTQLKKKLKNGNILSRVFCRECGTKAELSKALLNTLVSFDDLGNDAGQRGTTQSRMGPAELVDCHKCPNCGHSFIV